jgi:PKD repeat protein
VTVSDTSTGAPTSWAWNFGDGATSTAQNPPKHTYAQAGTYTVTLTATNATGSDTATKQVTVSSGGPPAAGVTLVADVKANLASPDKNYGSDATIRVKSGEYESFLRFTVSGLSGSVTGASLRLKAVTQANQNGGIVYSMGSTLRDGSTTWLETNITWNTRPLTGFTQLATVGPVDPAVNGGVVTVPLPASAFAGGNGTYNLALKTSSTSSAYYASKEAGGGAQLLLTTS